MMTMLKGVCAALLVAVATACSSGADGAELSEKVTARFEGSDGRVSAPFVLEVARTPKDKEIGLMFRTAMAPDRGMIFVSSQDTVQVFWMKNTYLSLDMLFLDRQLAVVGMLQNVPILNESPRKVDEPSRYVVELVAGTAARIGIRTGDKLVVTQGVTGQLLP